MDTNLTKTDLTGGKTLPTDLLSAAHSRMLVGDFFGAKSILLQMENTRDPEVLIDLASCMYVTQDINSFEDYTRKALELYEQNKKILSNSKRLSCRIKLGKLIEEMGGLAICLELYTEKITCRNSFDLERSQEILAQRLRLACCYLDIKEVSRLYAMAEKSVNKSSFSFLDLQHALIRSDLKLTGFEAAINRLQNLNKIDFFIPDEHRQWFYFDFVFACLEEGCSASIDLKLLSGFEYHSVGMFEKIVWDLLLASKGLDAIDAITANRTKGLSVLCAIRVLKVMCLVVSTDDLKNEARRKLNLLLVGLDLGSRKLVLERVRESKDELTVTTFTKIESKVIQAFLKSNRVPLSQLSQLVYNIDLDESILNRIRVTISRLNLKIKNEKKYNFRITIQDNFIIGSGEVPADWNVA